MKNREQLFGPDLISPLYGTEAPPLPLVLLLLFLSLFLFHQPAYISHPSSCVPYLSLSARTHGPPPLSRDITLAFSVCTAAASSSLETPIKVRQVKPRRAASKLGSVCAMETCVLAITHVAARMVCPGSWLGRVHSSRHFYTRQRSRC